MKSVDLSQTNKPRWQWLSWYYCSTVELADFVNGIIGNIAIVVPVQNGVTGTIIDLLPPSTFVTISSTPFTTFGP